MSEIRHPQKAHAWLPAEWDFGEKTEDGIGGPIPYDPLIIYVYDDAADDSEDGCAIFWFSLREVVISAFEGTSPGSNGLLRIRAGLADLIKWIDDTEPSG
jgi:hypothetical protein